MAFIYKAGEGWGWLIKTSLSGNLDHPPSHSYISQELVGKKMTIFTDCLLFPFRDITVTIIVVTFLIPTLMSTRV